MNDGVEGLVRSYREQESLKAVRGSRRGKSSTTEADVTEAVDVIVGPPS